MARKQVALVLSGGVSLGTYIAGALDELLVALNAGSAEYEVDIITGASAGATTAALTAHGLLYQGGRTGLYRAWVEQIDFMNLLDPDLPRDRREPLALFNARQLRAVADETLTWPDPRVGPSRAPCCAEQMTLGMTLTNVDGLPYVSRIRVPAAGRTEEFVQYRHSEQQTFYLRADSFPSAEVLDRIKQVAIASAAFPFVFPMVSLRRQAQDRDQYIQQPGFDGEAEFWYYDGGTFNNLPVDLAWHYIRMSQDTDDISDSRVIVVIDPSRERNPKLTPVYPSLPQYVVKLLQALRTESSALQFDREVLGPSMTVGRRMQAPMIGVLGGIPGVDRAEVELLSNFALVIPDAHAPTLHGAFLGFALSGFLDRKFREYDFRRGAADARRMARDLLQIDSYDAQRPGGEQFYHPEDDPQFQYDLSSYASLDNIPSSHDPQRSVRQVFEAALKKRVNALVDRWDPPGPNMVYRWVVNYLVQRQLPDLWIPEDRPSVHEV